MGQPFDIDWSPPRWWWSAGIHAETVASPFMAFHVAPNAKGLAAPRVWALEGLLPRVRVAVDAKAAGSAECFMAGRAGVSILTLRIRNATYGVQVVMVLPGPTGRG